MSKCYDLFSKKSCWFKLSIHELHNWHDVMWLHLTGLPTYPKGIKPNIVCTNNFNWLERTFTWLIMQDLVLGSQRNGYQRLKLTFLIVISWSMIIFHYSWTFFTSTLFIYLFHFTLFLFFFFFFCISLHACSLPSARDLSNIIFGVPMSNHKEWGEFKDNVIKQQFGWRRKVRLLGDC